MSFRLFIYYCALCGAGGALVGWASGRFLAAPGHVVFTQGLKAMWLGFTVAFALGLVDALWNFSPWQVFSIGGRVLTAVVVGSMGGLLGGLFSQALYQWKPNDAFLIAGWAFIGLLIGVSLGVFDLTAGVARGQNPRGAVRKIVNGVVGGTLGGLLGGFLSVLVRGAWGGLFHGKREDLLWSPSALGFVALGACIGLLIGLAQVILKEAWLRVEAGVRAGRELILAKPEITLGRAEACDLGLFGDPTIEKLHARIHRRGNDYFLSDAGSSSGTYVNDERVQDLCLLRSGDMIRLGRYLIRFGERKKRSPVVGG
jgi:hypothetical protein